MFMNSEVIVSLWFVPVVLSVLVPLSMLCIWGGLQLLRKVTRETAQIHKSAREALDDSYVKGLQPEPFA